MKSIFVLENLIKKCVVIQEIEELFQAIKKAFNTKVKSPKEVK